MQINDTLKDLKEETNENCSNISKIQIQTLFKKATQPNHTLGASRSAVLSSSGPMRAALMPWASHQRPSAFTQEPRRQTKGFSVVAHIS